MASSVKPEQFRAVYDPMFARKASAGASAAPLYDWRAQSTYIRRPPYWEGSFAGERALKGMRPLAVLGDNITTDHLSPSNAILPTSAAGEYLAKMGLPEEDFNSYATHRGDHLTAQRATFANPTLVNEMAVVDGEVKRGSLARVEPEGKVMRMWEAIETYMERKQPLIVIAGADYGQGSSRDWAAKGVSLAGVEAIAAEGFERIHRTNLIGMGVLPLEFKPGTEPQDAGHRRQRDLRRGGCTHAARRAHAGHPAQQRRARRGAGDLPPGHCRGSVDLRSRRRAAALRAGLPRGVAGGMSRRPRCSSRHAPGLGSIGAHGSANAWQGLFAQTCTVVRAHFFADVKTARRCCRWAQPFRTFCTCIQSHRGG